MNTKLILASILSLVLFTACTKDKKITPTPTPIEKVKIAEATTASGLVLTLWSDETNLKTGYNALYVSAVDANKATVKNLNISLLPMMDMGSMKHSSPVTQPSFNAETSLYQGAVVFTMPSGSMGTWNIKVSTGTDSATFDLNILASDLKVTGSYSGTDGAKYFVTLMPHKAWTVGLNDFTILINKMEDMNNFPVYDDFLIDFDPQMTSMGHGSPNNINPVSKGAGVYQGKVNYTMTGDWRLNFKLKRGDDVIVENAYVDVLF